MRRVVSLFLPSLAVERLRRLERSAPRQPERPVLELPVDDDPGACSVPRGGGWRPSARWAREGMPSRGDVEAQIAALPTHAQPPLRELGRRSEAASHPYKAALPAPRISVPAAKPLEHAPLALSIRSAGARRWSLPVTARVGEVVDHWVAYGIRPELCELEEGAAANPHPDFAAGEGTAGLESLIGLCPPGTDAAHHYHFIAVAMDSRRTNCPPV